MKLEPRRSIDAARVLSVLIKASVGRALVPWSIVEVNEQEDSFEKLFSNIQAGCFDSVTVSDDLKNATLQQSFVGNKTDALMVTSNRQSVLNVCSEFGKYVKLSVELSCDRPEPIPLLANAFAVMNASQRRLQIGDNGLPFPEAVKDGRDRLYNDLLGLMRDMGVSWNTPLAYGVPFLKRLRDSLWYIDGHHDTITEKAPKMPEVFARFTGYNRPEAHKHRKRARGNLSRSELRTHALALQDSLQASWFQKDHMKVLKEVTEGLVSTLNAYATYLQEKNKSQKLHHAMNCPAATPSDSSHLEYLPKIVTVSTALQPIVEAVKGKEPYVPVAVTDFSPGDRRQRYRYV